MTFPNPRSFAAFYLRPMYFRFVSRRWNRQNKRSLCSGQYSVGWRSKECAFPIEERRMRTRADVKRDRRPWCMCILAGNLTSKILFEWSIRCPNTHTHTHSCTQMWTSLFNRRNNNAVVKNVEPRPRTVPRWTHASLQHPPDVTVISSSGCLVATTLVKKRPLFRFSRFIHNLTYTTSRGVILLQLTTVSRKFLTKQYMGLSTCSSVISLNLVPTLRL